MTLIQSLPHYSDAKSFSENKLKTFRQAFSDTLIDEDVLVATSGSYARSEASPQSDLDFYIVGSRERTDDEKSALIEHCWDVVNRLDPALRDSAKRGTFGGYECRKDMLVNIGGDWDTNQKMTRRALFLLESTWLYGPAVLEDTRLELIERYISEAIDDTRVALFLLNDFIRYWRTICVDFEFKTTEGNDPKPWGLRNIKLTYSRKLLYFAGVVAIAETAFRTRTAKIEILARLLALPPVERVAAVCGERALPALRLYDAFLGDIGKSDIRDALDDAKRGQKDQPDVFRRLKNDSNIFTLELMKLLSDTYAPAHPIHRAIMF